MSSTKHREGMNQLWLLPGRAPFQLLLYFTSFYGEILVLSQNLAQILGQVFFDRMDYCLFSSSGFGLYYVTEFADFLREFILSFYLLVTEPALTSPVLTLSSNQAFGHSTIAFWELGMAMWFQDNMIWIKVLCATFGSTLRWSHLSGIWFFLFPR